MRPASRLAVAAAVALLIVAPAAPPRAHEFAFALTSVELNPGTGSLEIVHRLFVHDLEPALEAYAGRRVKLDVLEDFEPDLRRYVEERFSLADADGTPLPLAWIGAELDGDRAWIYQETPYDPALKGVGVKDRLLFEHNDKQVNSVNVLIGEHKDTLTLTDDEDTAALLWDDE